MKIAILGASGRTGRLVADLAVERGHHVVALVRGDPPAARDGVTIAKGLATDKADVARALAGCEAVISCLASTNSEAVCSKATDAVIAANGPRRYLTVGGAGVDAEGDEKGFGDKVVGAIMKVVVGKMLADRQKELATLQSSTLEWTMARPPRLTDKPGRDYRTSLQKPPSTAIGREALAAFLVDELEQGAFVRKAPFVAT